MSKRPRRCALCNEPVDAENSVYSPHRMVVYCAPPWGPCDARRKRILEKAARAEKKAAA